MGHHPTKVGSSMRVGFGSKGDLRPPSFDWQPRTVSGPSAYPYPRKQSAAFQRGGAVNGRL
jgi:hypothetical protein